MEPNFTTSVPRRSKDLNARAVQSGVLSSSSVEFTPDRVADQGSCNLTTKSSPAIRSHLPITPSSSCEAKRKRPIVAKKVHACPEPSNSAFEIGLYSIGDSANPCVYTGYAGPAVSEKKAQENYSDLIEYVENHRLDFGCPLSSKEMTPAIKLPEVYNRKYSDQSSFEWNEYGIWSEVTRDYLSAGKNSANELQDVFGKDNCCIPLDFKILVSDFIKVANGETSNIEDIKDLFKSSFVGGSCSGSIQQLPVSDVSNSNSKLNQNNEKINKVGKRAEYYKKACAGLAYVAQHYSVKSKMVSMPEINPEEQHYPASDVAYSSHSIDSYKFLCARREARGERIMFQPIHNYSAPRSYVRTESEHQVDQRSDMRREEGKAPSSPKKTYADSVLMSGRDAQYRKWLDSNFPCFPNPYYPTTAKDIPSEEMVPRARRHLAGNEGYNSLFADYCNLFGAGSNAQQEGSSVRPIHVAYSQQIPVQTYSDLVHRSNNKLQLENWHVSDSSHPRCSSYSEKLKEQLIQEGRLRGANISRGIEERFRFDESSKFLGARPILNQEMNLDQTIHPYNPDLSPEDVQYLLRANIELPYNPRRSTSTEVPYTLNTPKARDQRQNTNQKVKF